MNIHMDKSTLETRLALWGKWCLYNNQLNLGYPKASLFAVMGHNGGVAPYLLKGRDSPDRVNFIAEEMEQWVRRLFRADPLLARVLRSAYLDEGNFDERARRLGFSYAKYKRLCDNAKYWLLGAINMQQQAA